MAEHSANTSPAELNAAMRRLAELFRELRAEESKRLQAIGSEGSQCVKAVVGWYEAQIEALLIEIERLDANLAKVMRRTFARQSYSSGPRPEAQKSDDPKKVVDRDSSATKASKPKDISEKKTEGRQELKLPENMPVTDVYVSIGGRCPCGCEGGFYEMQSETQDRLAWHPGYFYIERTHYQKGKCKLCLKIVQAPRDKRVLARTRITTETAVAIIINKFADGLPLYRQEQIFKRLGVKISRGTLSRWVKKCAAGLKGVWEALLRNLRHSSALFIDETTVPVLEGGAGKARKCYTWVICRDGRNWLDPTPPGVAFVAPLSRGIAGGRVAIGQTEAIVHCDGHKPYETLVPDDRRANCNQHVRADIFEIHEKTGSPASKEILDIFDEIFVLERDFVELEPDDRVRLRQKYVRPLIEKLRKRVDELWDEVSHTSAFGKALKYIKRRWKHLTKFLDDGRIELSNNTVENLIRPWAIVRKNALFAATELGAENWAILASLIATCKMNNVDPYEYLVWALDLAGKRNADDPWDDLLPWVFAGQRSSEVANSTAAISGRSPPGTHAPPPR